MRQANAARRVCMKLPKADCSKIVVIELTAIQEWRRGSPPSSSTKFNKFIGLEAFYCG